MYGLWTRQRWAWPGTLALCVVLALWLVVEGVLIEFGEAVQWVTAVNGLVILLAALSPSVRKQTS